MKILIITQKVDSEDPVLGFFHRWIEEFAKYFGVVHVICLEEGKHDLPYHVALHSLGKEKGGGSKAGYAVRFYRLIWKLRNDYDAVFVHMNPEYVVLGGPVWRMLGKKIGLWYVHRQANMKLWLAEKLADDIFTSSKESFSIESKKVHYVGHGIDTRRFQHIPPAIFEPLSVAFIGRISRIKHIDTILRAVKILLDHGIRATIRLAGESITPDDRLYEQELKKMTQDLDLDHAVIWEGRMKNTDAISQASITVNAAPDGGMDKAILESFAAGRAAFMTNKAFEKVLGEFAEPYMYKAGDGKELVRKIEAFLLRSDKEAILSVISNTVSQQYDISVLMKRIFSVISSRQ